MCDLGWIDPADLWRESSHRARKPHVCDCCGGRIEPSSTYKRIFMIADGEPSTEKECSACSAMMIEFKRHHHLWFSPSGMADLLRECLDEEQTFDDNGERVPTEIGALWMRELDAMRTRRAQRTEGER